ncbi:MAG: nitrogen fixation protein NifZ [Zoogloeaceae bacterium]|jgi:nitrogen fixation protein NifZ|nr:nitrogen fixation protein NifZ [Zoogloeaceae bacterium]
MKARWRIDDEVRVIRNVRDDGTFPGARMGDLLVRRGSVGVIRDIGFFLQDQIIYSVHFPAENRVVGCREEELIDIAEDWTPSRFEFREKVKSRASLTVQDEILVQAGDIGEVVKVVRDVSRCPDSGIAYHVHFDALPGRVLQVPENMLLPDEPCRQTQPMDAAAPSFCPLPAQKPLPGKDSKTGITGVDA